MGCTGAISLLMTRLILQSLSLLQWQLFALLVKVFTVDSGLRCRTNYSCTVMTLAIPTCGLRAILFPYETFGGHRWLYHHIEEISRWGHIDGPFMNVCVSRIAIAARHEVLAVVDDRCSDFAMAWNTDLLAFFWYQQALIDVPYIFNRACRF